MFNPNFRYFNKWFVIGTITQIINQERTLDDGVTKESRGVEAVISTGSPSGVTRVRIPRTQKLPDPYTQFSLAFEEGSRVAFGLDRGTWLRMEEREHNDRTYRNFTQFAYPRLALQEEGNRAAGKIIGELTAKHSPDGQRYVFTVTVYETNKDGSQSFDTQGNERVSTFTLTAHGAQAQEVHNTPEGSNVEVSARLYNEVVRDDFGDIVDSSNELRAEKFNVLTLASAQPGFVPQFGAAPTPSFVANAPIPTQAPTPQFGGTQPAPTTNPTPQFGNPAPQFNTSAPAGNGAKLPFPQAGAQQFGGFKG